MTVAQQTLSFLFSEHALVAIISEQTHSCHSALSVHCALLHSTVWVLHVDLVLCSAVVPGAVHDLLLSLCPLGWQLRLTWTVLAANVSITQQGVLWLALLRLLPLGDTPTRLWDHPVAEHLEQQQTQCLP